MLLVFIFLLGCSGIVYEQNKETEVYFSPSANLNEKLIEFIDSANSTLYCAFYDMNEEIALSLAEKGKKIDVRLIMDDENKAISGSAVRVDGDGLMHNKFCIADSARVWTGSFNPTNRGSLNNNNVMIIHSEYIAHEYEDEFFEMWQGEFKSGKKVRQNKVILNNSTYEIYFCPEDNCGEHLLQKLNGAEKSIYFMLFSFTRKDVSDVLIENHLHGIDVKG
ncbi:hypothetical protein KY316_03220, partial [Candidatus Woesearchaeota archaeon]|nr:hypothetical protein [Candidatus Woesearchaeota archaeon]